MTIDNGVLYPLSVSGYYLPPEYGSLPLTSVESVSVYPDQAELIERIQRAVFTITTIITEIQQKFEGLLKDRPAPSEFIYKFIATFNNNYAEEDHAIRLEIDLVNKLFNSIMNPEYTLRPTLDSIKTTIKILLEQVSHISKDSLYYAMVYKLISEAYYKEALNCLKAVQEQTSLLTILKIQLELIVNPASHMETTQKVQDFLIKMADPKFADASVEFLVDELSESDITRLWIISRPLCEQFLQRGEEQLLRDVDKKQFLTDTTRKALRKLIGNEVAAEQGSVHAQYNLGLCYHNGDGVNENFKEAVRWFQMAAKQGYAPAQYNLGLCYHKGYGVDKNFKEAVRWYQMAAKQGYAPAQCNLGACYGNGFGVKEAVRWFQKAAEQGYAPAQFYLGCCYHNGSGVDRNLEEAVRWYQMAAEQGYAPAQFYLGFCYHNGSGVDRNLEEAVRWYQMAADQGLPEAKIWLLPLKKLLEEKIMRGKM